MAGQAGRRQVREVPHGRERLASSRAAKSQRVAGLAREDNLTEGLLVAGHQLVGMDSELLGDAGIVSLSGAPPDNVDGVFKTANPLLHRHVPGYRNDAQCQRYRVAL